MARKKAQTEATKSDFPVMGTYLMNNLCNLSAKPSPYTKKIGKKTMGRGASPTGKAAVRGRNMIKEAHGPQFNISTTLYEQNAPEASDTQRNIYIVPVSTPREDRVGSAGTFWEKRMYGQNTQ